jgi:hypothetical protein
MHFDLFSASFWESNAWQAVGVIATLITCIASPFLSTFVDRLFGKKEDQEHINAYKSLLLPEGGLGAGETILFLPIQAIAAYCLYLLGLRVWLWHLQDTTSWLYLSFVIIAITTWGLSAAKRKTLAKLLTWHLCIATSIFLGLELGQHGATLLTHDFSPFKHWLGQHLSADIKQLPVIVNLRSLSLEHVPVDIAVHSPAAARSQFIWIYGLTLAFVLVCYTLYKRHYANRIRAFVHLSERRRREELDLLDYEQKRANLEITALTKQEKEAELDLKKDQRELLLERERLAVEKERLNVESCRLDLEKKRAEYTLDLAVRLIDTLYDNGGNPVIRTELLRNTLPALKDFGHPEKDSTTVVMEVLRTIHEEPPAIPATVVAP